MLPPRAGLLGGHKDASTNFGRPVRFGRPQNHDSATLRKCFVLPFITSTNRASWPWRPGVNLTGQHNVIDRLTSIWARVIIDYAKVAVSLEPVSIRSDSFAPSSFSLFCSLMRTHNNARYSLNCFIIHWQISGRFELVRAVKSSQKNNHSFSEMMRITHEHTRPEKTGSETKRNGTKRRG